MKCFQRKYLRGPAGLTQQPGPSLPLRLGLFVSDRSLKPEETNRFSFSVIGPTGSSGKTRRRVEHGLLFGLLLLLVGVRTLRVSGLRRRLDSGGAAHLLLLLLVIFVLRRLDHTRKQTESEKLQFLQKC